MTFIELSNHIRSCSACPIRAEAKEPVAFEVYLGFKPLLFIGRNAGSEEDEGGVPFIGKAGGVLNSWIITLGFLRKEVPITNILKCHTLNNRAPSFAETCFCRDQFLQQEFELIKPRVVFLLGDDCLHAFMNDSVKTTFGSIYEYRIWGQDVALIPLFHPGYILRKPSMNAQVLTFLSSIKDLVQSTVDK